MTRLKPPSIAVLFSTFGPYHLARLKAAAQLLPVSGLELEPASAEYAWNRSVLRTGGLIQSVFSGSAPKQADQVRAGVCDALANLNPNIVAVPGYGGGVALSALLWCLRNNRHAILMSESQECDEARQPWREWIKRKLVGLYASGLVGGESHARYLSKLGMPPNRIFLGYDAVDNEFFSRETAAVRTRGEAYRTQLQLPQKFFLASARFVQKKNLPCLLQAYARYRELALRAASGDSLTTSPWSLVLLGDGPLRPVLETQVASLNLRPHVQMPGFRQYPELPAYYACASVFVHASITEQWGLVVNEAMASGLPVLVSNRCGCRTELVHEGVNGFTFDPRNHEELARLMLRISMMSDDALSAWGDVSRRIVASWGPMQFAAGLKKAVDTAQGVGPVKPTLMQKSLLRVLLGR